MQSCSNTLELSNAIIYTVRQGDTVSSICKTFAASPEELLEMNDGIDSGNIYIGQQIYIPCSSAKGLFSYISGKDDTLYSISQKFRIFPISLRKGNPGLSPSGTLEGQRVYIPKHALTYTNTDLNIKLSYPSNWGKIINERYAGSDGFFQISATTLKNLAETSLSEAYQYLKPYGALPVVSQANLHGCEACFIFPSEDQPKQMEKQAALFMSLPKPVRILTQEYKILTLFADKYHIREIAGSLVLDSKSE